MVTDDPSTAIEACLAGQASAYGHKASASRPLGLGSISCSKQTLLSRGERHRSGGKRKLS